MPLVAGISASTINNTTGSAILGGYFAGGYDFTSNIGYNTMDKLIYSSETMASFNKTLSYISFGQAGIENSGNAGYLLQYPNSLVNSLNKIIYKYDVTQEFPNFFTTVGKKWETFGLSNRGTAGYWAGGYDGAVKLSTIQKLSFSNDSIAIISATLDQILNQDQGNSVFNNNGIAGYVYSGSTSTGSNSNNVNKLNFSNDTCSISNTSTDRFPDMCCMSNNGVAGYGAGSYSKVTPTGYAFNAMKYTYSTETTSTTSSSWSVNAWGGAGVTNNGIAGYFSFGHPRGASATVTTVGKLDYSTETATTLSATTKNANGINEGVSNYG